jgi:N-acetyl-gamma-glutamyl-phosphate reductase
MKKIKAGIIGAAGYTGGELIRLLVRHPQVDIVFVHSRSQAGEPVTHTHQDLLGDTDLKFTDSFSNDIDVLFLCLGHGESKKFLQENKVGDTVKVIDLANDFRLSADAIFEGKEFTYGLPELQKEKIKTAQNIANPGCFATALQLGLLPLVKEGLVNEAYSTGITGSTGAGQSFSATSHFSWRANNIQAYKTLTHQHLGEINQSLQQVSGGATPAVHFVPWRGDFTRGIFVSTTVRTDKTIAELENIFNAFYQDAAFVQLSTRPIFLKQVVGTNKALLQLEKQGELLVVHSAIDNLLKGASGQAVQNMNLLFGLEEITGLQLKANYF